jgi:hypothetical protein
LQPLPRAGHSVDLADSVFSHLQDIIRISLSHLIITSVNQKHEEDE